MFYLMMHSTHFIYGYMVSETSSGYMNNLTVVYLTVDVYL